MADKVLQEYATTGLAAQWKSTGITLTETKGYGLWSVHDNRDHCLSKLVQAVFGETPRPGKMLTNNSFRLIHLWPHKAYLRSTESSLPGPLNDFNSMVTDISHGFCELSLLGNNPFEFLNSYTSADLTATSTTASCNLRCLLGQYPIILWWDDTAEIRILVDRSYAQSFCDYLAQLYLRWSAKSI
jgi:sarcosine oxidase gamma subunit